jgi:hypothetical protein
MNVASIYRPLTASVVACWSAVAGCALAQPTSEHASNHEQQGKELVLFLSGEAHHVSSSTSTAALNEDAWLSADIVLALTRDRFRLFGEYLLTSEEHDLERFQLGYELIPNTVAWLGRFHQPASAWNTEHHHGRYLQTSITRPSIELWEDENGIVPQHISGLLVDSRRPMGDLGGLHISVGAGLGPRITEGKLDPLDLLDPHEGGRHTSWTARFGYLPDAVGASEFGIVLARHRIPVRDQSIVNSPLANEVRQAIYGAFGHWSQEPWRVVGAIYDVRVGLRGPATSKDEHFVAGYLEVDRNLPRALVVYGRLEDSVRATRSSYLSGNYPDFELRRAIVGLRWDVLARHAVTFEAGRGETVRARQTEFRLQWSAALP